MPSFYKQLDISASIAAQKIRRDLTDRCGFRQVWGETPHETRKEMLSEWKEIVTNAFISMLPGCPTCLGEAEGCSDPWHEIDKVRHEGNVKRSL